MSVRAAANPYAPTWPGLRAQSRLVLLESMRAGSARFRRLFQRRVRRRRARPRTWWRSLRRLERPAGRGENVPQVLACAPIHKGFAGG
eukprot:4126014-Alexandrium_andersonii.AAC.1